MKRTAFSICLSLLIASCNSGSNPGNIANANSITEYFKNSQLQVETDDQRQEIILVLSDLLTTPVNQLRTKKYKDYRLQPDQWDIIKFLHAYFISSSNESLSADQFFEDIGKPEGRHAIEEQLLKIRKYFQDHSEPPK
jgi:hypothetical protein